MNPFLSTMAGRVRAVLPAGADLRAMGRSPRRDLLAGLTIAVVALPLALGFGVSSRLGALTHAAVLAVIVFAAAPLVSRIPLAALAGVLLATAIRMVEIGSLRAMAKATRPDAVVLVLTAAATLVLDLVYALVIGLVVAGALALKDAVQKLNRRGIAVMTSGVRPDRRQALDAVGALDLLRHEGREYATTPEAIAGARKQLERAGLLPPAHRPLPHRIRKAAP